MKKTRKDNQVVIQADKEIISQYFHKKQKQVVTFIGYSGSAYEDKDGLISKSQEILSKFNPSDTIINIGATYYGIGEVYKISKNLGFETTGIVSSKIHYSPNHSPFSYFCDVVFLINDNTYGGFIDQTKEILSPTSEIMVNNSDYIIVLGGGQISCDEFQAAKKLGKKVAFYPFDSNHAKNRYNRIDFSSPVAQFADLNDTL